jgi:DNA-binding response OmpR family regulator
VVDDEDDIRDVVKEGLTMKGFRVLSASNGEEGLRLALTEKPDVILMDVLLGAENGIDVERKIKNQLSSFVPVILMTGQDDLREKITGGNSEPDELLAKPFQMEELFSRVRSMTRLKKMMDEIERTRQKSHNPKARENS